MLSEGDHWCWPRLIEGTVALFLGRVVLMVHGLWRVKVRWRVAAVVGR